MTHRDLEAIEAWADLAGDKRERAQAAGDAAAGEALNADADRLETLIAFYKASLPAD